MSFQVAEKTRTGKTDVRYILEAFEQGADGVYVIACPIGNCHHVRGNERGRARVLRARQILEEIGLDGKRLGIFFMSGSQAQTFAAAANTMTERVRELGPNPLGSHLNGNGHVNSALRQAQQTIIDSGDEEIGFRGRKPR